MSSKKNLLLEKSSRIYTIYDIYQRPPYLTINYPVRWGKDIKLTGPHRKSNRKTFRQVGLVNSVKIQSKQLCRPERVPDTWRKEPQCSGWDSHLSKLNFSQRWNKNHIWSHVHQYVWHTVHLKQAIITVIWMDRKHKKSPPTHTHFVLFYKQ